MDALIEFIESNPAYAVGAVALLLFVITALIKRAAILAVIAVVLNAGYGYYLAELVQEFSAQAEDKAAVVSEKAEVVAEQVESARETVEAAAETLDKAGELVDQASALIER